MVTKDYEKEKKNKLKKIIKIIIIIIIILLLLQRCSNIFNWTIGNLFGTTSDHDITEESDDIIVLNKNLLFETKETTIYLDYDNYKVGYTYNLINPKEFTCTTSDADIATCYVEDGYVVIKPKK